MTKKLFFESLAGSFLFTFVSAALREAQLGPQPTCGMSAVALPCTYSLRLWHGLPAIALLGLVVWAFVLLGLYGLGSGNIKP